MSMVVRLVVRLVVTLLLARDASAVTLAQYNRCEENVRWGYNFGAVGRSHGATGDCDGTLYFNGASGAPLATLAEITLASNPTTQDFYDVSLIDGYNIPIVMTPFHGLGANCMPADCVCDLNCVCPTSLTVRGGGDNRVVGYRNADAAYDAPQYCCTGQFGSPLQCKLMAYSRLFKTACPNAYSLLAIIHLISTSP
ncbi:hypothetical protein ABZP36_012524 [Zizania latifolia]